jgi:hypothetical protein
VRLDVPQLRKPAGDKEQPGEPSQGRGLGRRPFVVSSDSDACFPEVLVVIKASSDPG